MQEYLRPYEDELTETSRERLAKNPLRILDTKVEHEQKLLEDAPRLIDTVVRTSRAHYETGEGLPR
ncbi:MAG: hypothetical protein U5R48_12465 [Gammaproteobacteria bacterium]|nr:hypothetical protein [Gammaproteobacteria bacterium]